MNGVNRDSQMIGFLAEGLSNKEIMQRTGLTHRGVTWWLEKFKRRFGLYGPADSRRLIVKAIEARRQ